MNLRNARRADGRKPGELRPVTIELNPAPNAAGSALIAMGNTRVLCAVMVEEDVPAWMKKQKVEGGWVTAEYSMLPYSTPERTKREVSSGKISGRTQEIQRLIGRSLRAVIDLNLLGPRTLWFDCDVLQADGGTRTASITGAWVAARLAVDRLLREGKLTADPLREAVAAVSVGIVGGRPVLDLNYEEDVACEVDMNIVMTSRGRWVEIQGTAEEEPFTRDQLEALLAVASRGLRRLFAAQRAALRSVKRSDGT
ncbi:MAG: ribonuclease PH [Kiritimatiellae bacterium]|nr:ribonuclease PH [Kiritimatiellia bacterium]